MSCCSSQRNAARLSPILRAAVTVAQPQEPAATNAKMRYIGKVPLSLRGPFSGVVYRIGPSQRTLDVDPRDLDAMMRTGLFERS
jgi:hypothetical protein